MTTAKADNKKEQSQANAMKSSQKVTKEESKSGVSAKPKK
jgi:hypothetical protein